MQLQQTTDGRGVTMTSGPRDSLTSRDSYVITTTGSRSNHGNSVRGNGVRDTTSVLTASGRHVTTLSDMTSSLSTGSGVEETAAPPSGGSSNYSNNSDRVTMVAVVCVCVVLLAIVLVVVTVLMVR